MEEIWKDIQGYEGLYQVSNLGRIKSLDRTVSHIGETTRNLKGKILINKLTPKKYYKVELSFNCVYKTHEVHRLVAKAFIPNSNKKLEINHKNGIKTDNRVENLEWVTHRENLIHSYHVLGNKCGFGVLKKTYGEHNVKSKLKHDDVIQIIKNKKNGISTKELSIKYNVSTNTIHGIFIGKYWKHIDRSNI